MSIGKWIVKVNAGFWMAGVHRFQTKKAAKEFIHEWVMADASSFPANAPSHLNEISRPMLETAAA